MDETKPMTVEEFNKITAIMQADDRRRVLLALKQRERLIDIIEHGAIACWFGPALEIMRHWRARKRSPGWNLYREYLTGTKTWFWSEVERERDYPTFLAAVAAADKLEAEQKQEKEN